MFSHSMPLSSIYSNLGMRQSSDVSDGFREGSYRETVRNELHLVNTYTAKASFSILAITEEKDHSYRMSV